MPFDIELTAPNGTHQTVCCQECLRVIKHRRTVFAGLWQGHPVIIKRFEDFFSSYRCRREKRGLQQLLALGLVAPKVLLAGKDSAGHHILVIEKIEKSVDVLTAVQSAPSEDAARDILLSVFCYIARMHQVGVTQQDLHLGNFLAAKSQIYAIDPACMRFSKKPVSLAQSRRQLAVLFATLQRSTLSWTEELLKAYCSARGQTYTPEMLDCVGTLIDRRRKQYLPHALKKTLRNSKHFFILEAPSYRGVFHRDAIDAESARQFIETFKMAMAPEEVGGKVDIAGREYKVIQYKPNNKFIALWYSLIGSPARREWLAAWRMIYSGQPKQPPLALIEYHYGLAWIIREKEKD